jgi:hypothetical protein
MPDKLELSVERIGEKLVFQVDPNLVRFPSCCCSCNYWIDSAAIAALVLPKPAATKQ